MVQPSEQDTKGKPTNPAKQKAKPRNPGRKGLAGLLAPGADVADTHLALVEKAWGYKVRGFGPRAIAEAIADEFGLVGAIHHKTIYQWLDEGRAMTTRKLAQHREEHVATVIPRTEDQLLHWMPIANGKKQFAIARMEQIGDQYVEVIDDHVFREQAAAANIVLKTMEQQRKVLGVGLANAAEEADGKAMSLTQVQLFFQNIVNVSAAKPGAQVVQGSAVAIEAGDPSIDQL